MTSACSPARFGARAVVFERDGGVPALVAAATAKDVDLVLVATSGIDGIEPTLAALEAGKSVALANKETLVAAGHLVRRYVGGAASGCGRSTASTARSGSA